MRVFSRTTATIGAAVAIAAVLGGTALADPPSGTVPAHTDIVGVGSDTSQAVLDQLSTDYNSGHSAPKLYSWDATGSSAIVNKTGCASVARPNGSGAGIAALKAGARPSGDATDYCVDFARSSRGPQAGDGSSTLPLAFIAYAQDAVSWSFTNTTASPTHAPTALSIKQLKAIYSCDASVLGTGHTGNVTWDEVGGTGTNQVVPVIPQSSSGTRSFFLGAIGVTTLNACVVGTDNSVEENEGTNAVFSGIAGPPAKSAQDMIFPYSIAVYLAQSEHGHGSGTQGNQVLGSVLNTATPPVAIAPTTGTAPNATLNPALATVGLTRNIYNVVRATSTSPFIPTYLQGIFNRASTPSNPISPSGYICTDTTAQADITSYGFRLLGANCGAVTVVSS